MVIFFIESSILLIISTFFINIQSLSDERYQAILEEIRIVIHDETHYHKGTLNMRTQKLFSVKVMKTCVTIIKVSRMFSI